MPHYFSRSAGVGECTLFVKLARSPKLPQDSKQEFSPDHHLRMTLRRAELGLQPLPLSRN